MRLSTKNSFLLSILVVASTSSSSVVESAPARIVEEEQTDLESAPARIVGGEQTKPGDYPYFVNMFGCGGTLIAADTVLFAAECGNYRDKQIVIGAYDTTNPTAEGAQVRFCQEWIPDPLAELVEHPYPFIQYTNYDFALCKLDKLVEMNTKSIEIEINEDDSVPSIGDDLQVVGLGTTDFPFLDFPTILLEVTQPYIGNRNCNRETSYNGAVTDVMLCAGFLEEGGKTCLGDSGGPLIKRTIRDDGSIVDIHVGLVTWGTPCALPGFPSVYARTSKRADWIKTIMCNDFQSVAPFCNNTKPESSPPSDCENGQKLTISLTTDAFPSDNNWILRDSENTKVEGRRYSIEFFENEHELCLKQDECYTWELNDSFSDGMCATACGSYSLALNGEEIFSGDGTFTSGQKHEFCTECKNNQDFRYNDKNKNFCRNYLKSEDKEIINKRCNKIWKDLFVYDWCPRSCGEKAGLGQCASYYKG